MSRILRPLLPLLPLLLAASPAAAVSSGFIDLSYGTPMRSDSASVIGGGPPEEGNPPLPVELTLTTPVPETPGVDDAYIGLRGEIDAAEGGGPGVYLQSVGAAVGGAEFESPFGGTIPNTILWSDDPVGDGPFDVWAHASVQQEVRYQLLADELLVDFQWDGELLFFSDRLELPPGASYEYGYSLVARIFSTVEDGFYSTFPEIGALGGPGLEVRRNLTLSPTDEAFVFDLDSLHIPFFNTFDIGNYFRVELALDVWIHGEGFEVSEYALIQNTVDFAGTLGVTAVDGGVIAAPEPGTAALAAAAGLLGLLAVGRRRRG